MAKILWYSVFYETCRACGRFLPWTFSRRALSPSVKCLPTIFRCFANCRVPGTPWFNSASCYWTPGNIWIQNDPQKAWGQPGMPLVLLLTSPNDTLRMSTCSLRIHMERGERIISIALVTCDQCILRIQPCVWEASVTSGNAPNSLLVEKLGPASESNIKSLLT